MSNKDTETDWSESELQAQLLAVIQHYNRPLAFFLDGLDEVYPQDGVLRLCGLLDTIKQLAGASVQVKICLASRPETLISTLLGRFPKLRLENLNHADLQRYATAHITIPPDYNINASSSLTIPRGEALSHRRTLHSHDELAEWLVNTLVGGANGIFLWLCLTVSTVCQALREGETIEDLESRINTLPTQLADLFADMWTRANGNTRQIRKRAASYLQLALYKSRQVPKQSFDCMTMALAMNQNLMRQVLDAASPDPTMIEKLTEACEWSQQDTLARCAGLLRCTRPREVPESEEYAFPWYGGVYGKLQQLSRTDYRCIHRTAFDFFDTTGVGQAILADGEFPGSVALHRSFEADLAYSRLFRHATFICDDRGGAIMQKCVTSYLYLVLSDLWPTGSRVLDADVAETLRLLRQCERLFRLGVLSLSTVTPPRSMRYIQGPFTPGMRTSYGTSSVQREHEFLLELAHSKLKHEAFRFILLLMKDRRRDAYTLSRLLHHACSLEKHFDDAPGMISKRRKSIETLLQWGADTYTAIIYPQNVTQWGDAPAIEVEGTPLRALITSLWYDATQRALQEGYFRKLCDLASLLVAHGANLHEELHVVLEIKRDFIAFRELWRFDLRERRPACSTDDIGHLVVIVAYSFPSILSLIRHICFRDVVFSADGALCDFQWDWQSQGRVLAVVDLNSGRPRESRFLTPPIFCSEDIFPESLLRGSFEELTHLVKFATDCLKEPRVVYNHANIFYGYMHCKTQIPPDIQSGTFHALERIRALAVPVEARRRELRASLGVQTPLEDFEWQNNNEAGPPFTDSDFIQRVQD
ncbi:uncharacterized protein B0I36DRAFT_368118 [Microdochium trichocladiopsis]|uniref:DUF7791 domain-containing protein n=1 Tax=Microdochium trichocladiopsis TaxID=1682393 RepID=A0A9P8XTY5_9PEZI|nr:uncharacterized protein B0I36DRAFT_368118 [Microdochium trichocladiopsis]KAH7018069.1 hypothetical protein B0I36DRAFT_368118 [Microdochium trichocladiopsis]